MWRIDTKANYGELNEISQNKINIELICRHWEDILRVAGSLKSGKVNATELTKSLQRNGQPTSLGKAITEYGKVYKTKHGVPSANGEFIPIRIKISEQSDLLRKK